MRYAVIVYIAAAISFGSLMQAQQQAGMVTAGPAWVPIAVGLAWPGIGVVAACAALDLCEQPNQGLLLGGRP